MPGQATHTRQQVIVMGVSGSGKSTLAKAVALALDMLFVEGDDLHSPRNIAQMRAGQPLDDADRAAWLEAIAAILRDETRYPQGVVLTCSALKRAYREQLRRACAGLSFLFLDIGEAIARQRLQGRPRHFMPASLVASQFATLQRPGADETDVVTLDGTQDPLRVLATALQVLRLRSIAAPGTSAGPSSDPLQ